MPYSTSVRRRLSLAWIFVAVVPAMLGGASGGCRDATQLQVRVYTNVPHQAGMTVAIWAGPDIRGLSAPVAKVTSSWGADGTIGSLGIVPAGSRDGPVAVRVALGLPGRDAETCGQNGDFSRCIVARRSLAYLEHRGLDLPVGLFATCEAKACDDDTTCNAEGQCVTARIDPAACTAPSACLPPGDPPPGGLSTVDGGAPDAGAVDGGSDAPRAPPPPPRDVFMSDLARLKGEVQGTARIKPALDETAIVKYRLDFPGGSAEVARGSTADVPIGLLSGVPNGAMLEARSVGFDGQLSSPVTARLDNAPSFVPVTMLRGPVIDALDDRIVGFAKVGDNPFLSRLDCTSAGSCAVSAAGAGIGVPPRNELFVLAVPTSRLLLGIVGSSFIRCAADTPDSCAAGPATGFTRSTVGSFFDAPRNEAVMFGEGDLLRVDATGAIKRRIDVPTVEGLRPGVWVAPTGDEVITVGNLTAVRCTNTVSSGAGPAACTSHDVSAGRGPDALGYLPRVYVRGDRVYFAGIRTNTTFDPVIHACEYPLTAAPTCVAQDVGVGGGAVSEGSSGRYGDSVYLEEADTLFMAQRGPGAALTLYSCRLPTSTCVQYPLGTAIQAVSPSIALDRKNRRLVIADDNGVLYLDTF